MTFKEFEKENKPHLFSVLGAAAFIWSWPRDRLYELLDPIGMQRIIYCYKDSVIHVLKYDEPLLLTKGKLLRQLTCVLKGGWKMKNLYLFGCKNYRFFLKSTRTMEYVYKFRGMLLNYRSSQVIYFNHFVIQSMISMILHKYEGQIISCAKRVTKSFAKDSRKHR